MTLPGAPEPVGEIRATVSRLAAGYGFSEQEIEAIRLAVSEAAGNAVIHA
jgi:anti-sigma regulatory factor (Ser/Thr protein kinase)